MTISYASDCKYSDDAKSKMDFPIELIKIAPYIAFYKKQVDHYNQTAYEIITNELALILLIFSKQE